MKNISFEQAGPPFSEERARALEAAMGACLPEDFRSFLSRGNSGILAEGSREYRVPDHYRNRYDLFTDEDVEICCISSVSDSVVDTLDIFAALDAISGRVPPLFLPFGKDLFGNRFCIGLSPLTWGTIYFWDHELHPGDDLGESLFEIAGSFSEFIEGLS